MRIAFIAIAVIGIFAGVVTIVGWALPVKHRATRMASYKRPPANIYTLIMNTSEYPLWRTGIRSVEDLPETDGVKRFRETGSNGTIPYKIESSTPDSKIVTRIDDKRLPFGGTWTYEITPTQDGAQLRITEDGEVYNPIFRVVSRFFMGYTKTIDDYLTDVGRHFSESTKIED